MDNEVQFMPQQASSFAGEVDALYAFLWGISGVMTILIGALILYFAIKYRRGSPADRSTTASHFFFIEASWIVGPFLVTMIMFFWGAKLYFVQSRAPAGAMEITGVGRQWMWKFQHPDGRAETNDLHVPLGEPVKVRLISEDVIHSMYVPAFRQKQDVLPGRYTTFWFKPTRVGKYHLFCAEYCGTDHSRMRGYVYVLEPSKYQEWLARGPGREGNTASNGKLFDQLRCASCHQGGGMQSRGPLLDELFGKQVRLQDGRMVIADETYIRESILRPQAKIVAGYQPIMPSFEGQLDEEGLNRLIAEIKALGRGDRPRGTDEDAEQKSQGGPEQLPLEQQQKKQSNTDR